MKLTVKDISKKKEKGEKITCLTAYDYSFARLLDEAGVDVLLVGDSLGMVCLGYDSTLPVTMREMLHHAKAVSRGTRRALIVADMPFGSYQHSPEKAVRNATRFLKEAGADAVKLEGGSEMVPTVKALRKAGVPVMGHLGLTPQKESELGGYKLQGRTRKEALKILEDAKELEDAGVFSLVLECIPWQAAQAVTGAVKVPTIGIGAGPHCDGQVLVLYDLLGLQETLRPRFVRVYAPLGQEAKKAAEGFIKDVRSGNYPSLSESFNMPAEEFPEKIRTKK